MVFRDRKDAGGHPAVERDLAAQLRRAAVRLRGTAADYDPLLERIDDARLVLIGEASHGTHEFYSTRAAITVFARLILCSASRRAW